MAHLLLKYSLLTVFLALCFGVYLMLSQGRTGTALVIGVLAAGTWREVRTIFGSNF